MLSNCLSFIKNQIIDTNNSHDDNSRKKRQTGKKTIYDKHIYIGRSSSGEIEILLTGKQIKSICTIGENDIAVTEVSNSLKIQELMKRYTDEQLLSALKEMGRWNDNELRDRQENINRLVWMLAWDIFDSDNPNECL